MNEFSRLSVVANWKILFIQPEVSNHLQNLFRKQVVLNFYVPYQNRG